MRHRSSNTLVVWCLLISLVAGALAAAPTGSAAQPGSVREYLLARPAQKIQPELADALAAAGPADPLQILVQFQDTQLRTRHVTTMLSLGFVSIVRFRILPVAFAVGTRSQVQALASRSDVRRLELNQTLSFDLDRSTKAIKADEGVWDRYVKDGDLIGLPLDGSGVTIAVIDSGVDATHPDLELGTKTVANKKFLGYSVGLPDNHHSEPHGIVYHSTGLWADAPNTDTTSDHGTHVSGIAAGTGTTSAGAYRGTAPGAKIYGLSVGEGINIFNALAAYDLIYHELVDSGNPLNIRVINNSYGAPGEFDPDDFLHQAIMILSYDMDAHAPPGRRFNQHVVFSGGNVRITDPNNQLCTNQYGRVPVSISVAMVSATGLPPNDAGSSTDAVDTRSCRGTSGRPWEFPDLAAPGTDILSAANHSRGLFYYEMSGTSMAAPHVAGTVALMLQANPDLTLAGVPDVTDPAAPANYLDPFLNEITEVEWILKATAENVPGSGNAVSAPAYLGGTHSPDDGFGLIDTERAVATAFALRELRETDPTATVDNALAAADGLIVDVVETHEDVNTLSTGWGGRTITAGTPGPVLLYPPHPLTVPEDFEALSLDLRWSQPPLRPTPTGQIPKPVPADLDLRIEYPTTGDTVAVRLTQAATPQTSGHKSVTITPADLPANTILGDPSQPWGIQAITQTGAAVDVDYSITADLTHDGHWDVPRNQTTFVPNSDPTSEQWGDWHNADNGEGAGHTPASPGSSHSIDMRYYDLGSDADLHWARPGTGTLGSSKFDPRAIIDPAQLPTRSIRLSHLAWTAWHQGTGGIVTPPVLVSELDIAGDTSGVYLSTVTLGAQLLFDGAPAPAGRLVEFELGAQQVSATTNSSGVAQATLQLLQPPGTYTLSASFAGPGAPPAAESTPFTIHQAPSALGLTARQQGSEVVLEAKLTHAGLPSVLLADKSVSFTRNGSALGTVNTAPNGVATFVVSDASPADYQASFGGDSFYTPSISGLISFVPLPKPTIAVPAADEIVRERNVTVSGSAVPSSTVEVFADGVSLFTTTASGGGGWSRTLPIEDGVHTLTATNQVGGSVSEPSSPVTFTVDTTVFVEILTVPNPIKDAHVSSVRVTGVSMPDASVSVVLSDGPRSTSPETAVAGPSGGWEVRVDAQGIANGPVEVKATASRAGGIGVDSVTVTKDTSPQPPRVRIMDDGFGYIGDEGPIELNITHNGPEPHGSGPVTVEDSEGTLVEVGEISGLPMGQTATLTVDSGLFVDGEIIGKGVINGRQAAHKVILDRGAPQITVYDPAAVYFSLPFYKDTVFRGNATDGVSGVDRVSVYLRQGSTAWMVFGKKTGGAHQLEWEADFRHLNLLPGSYTIEATAFNRAGNRSETVRRTVLIL